MNHKIASFVIVAFFLLTAGTCFAAVNYSIDTLSVYQTDSNVLGSGTGICIGVDILGVSASCGTNLLLSTDYRFELSVLNSGNPAGSPDQFVFQNVYSASNVLGSDAILSLCGCVDDSDVNQAGVVSTSGDDVVCTFTDKCSVANSDSDVFYFVFKTGSDALTETGTFLISDGVNNDSSAETTFSYCIYACDANSDCDDSNSLTIDECTNPSTCSSACTHTLCPITCHADADCDDSDSSTTDTCSNAGTCSASCSNVCVPVCSSDGDCNDSNSLTTDVCNNAGACDASCSNSACAIACSTNADCDDSNSLSADICANAGTCSASCSYEGCTPACFANADCSDGLATTIDTCNNAGACDANCTNVVCTPECNSDLDCDDFDSDTKNICIHPGGCGAHCIYNYCAPECETNADCDDGDLTTNDVCLGAGSCTATCSNEACDIVCSSDSDCDDSKLATKDVCNNPGTCSASCVFSEQKQFLFEFVSDFNAVKRGQIIDLNIILKDLDGNPVEGAELLLTDSEGNEIEFESTGAGNYSGSYTVPADVVLGIQTLSFLASKGEFVGVEDLVLEIEKGSIKAVLIEPAEPKVLVGKKLELKFRVVYDNNESVVDANVSAEINGVSIPLTASGNIFSGHYLFSTSDLEGAFLIITANDSIGNSGTTTILFSVEEPLPLSTIIIAVAIIIAAIIAIYGLKRTHELSKLLHKVERLKGANRAAKLQHSIAKEKSQREKLAKKIAQQEKDLVKAKQDVETERRKQAFAVKKIPSESKYAVHGAGVGFVSKIKRLFSRTPKKTGEQLQIEKRFEEIDKEVEDISEKIKNLESEYFKQTIKEDFFRKKLFEYREKMHLLELEKKKIE